MFQIEIVEIVSMLAGDLQRVAKPFRRDQRGHRALSLDQCIRDQGRAMHDLVDVLDGNSGLAESWRKPVGDCARRLVGRRERLGNREMPGFTVEEQEVGECSADVDADSRRVCHAAFTCQTYHLVRVAQSLPAASALHLDVLTFLECGSKIRAVEERIGFERSEYAPETKRKASRGGCEPGANRARNGSWSRDPKDDLGHRVGIAGVSTVIRSGVSAGRSSPYMSSGRRTPPMWVVPRTCKTHLRPSLWDGGFLFVRRLPGVTRWFKALLHQCRKCARVEASRPHSRRSRSGLSRQPKRPRFVPIYREVMADTETPVSAFVKIKRDAPAFLLESVEGGQRVARYSFIGSEPFLDIVSR